MRHQIQEPFFFGGGGGAQGAEETGKSIELLKVGIWFL